MNYLHVAIYLPLHAAAPDSCRMVRNQNLDQNYSCVCWGRNTLVLLWVAIPKRAKPPSLSRSGGEKKDRKATRGRDGTPTSPAGPSSRPGPHPTWPNQMPPSGPSPGTPYPRAEAKKVGFPVSPARLTTRPSTPPISSPFDLIDRSRNYPR
jgi:hypothetical protein